MPGDIVFSIGTLIMAWDFLAKLRTPRGFGERPAGAPLAASAD